MKTDRICAAYSGTHVNLTVRPLAEENGSEPTEILIEGSTHALRMLAELLVAVADEADNDGFSISPFGAGREHFSSSATLGLYIHRLDK